MMDKHWANLLIEPCSRSYGNTSQSKAHRDEKRKSAREKAIREAGHAFCDRYAVRVLNL